ncbi:MAG: TIGR02453 family protein [Chryseobacterium sp.]|nr:MAG: TIGR02453 family protein [Chryseobacterium sp.]
MKNIIHPETLNFLSTLEINNNREWFNENKHLYLSAKENVENVVNEIISGVSEFDNSLERLEAKNCIFRIYKDTRFSKDKTPYKTNIGASLVEKGPKTLNHAGYYIHLEPGKSFLAGGVYMTEPKNLKAIRERISAEGDEFLKILNKKTFKDNLELRGDKLVKVPQGFDKENPMGDYLKFKQFTVFHPLSNEDVLDKNFVKNTVNIFEKIYPFNSFLNEAIAN